MWKTGLAFSDNVFWDLINAKRCWKSSENRWRSGGKSFGRIPRIEKSRGRCDNGAFFLSLWNFRRWKSGGICAPRTVSVCGIFCGKSGEDWQSPHVFGNIGCPKNVDGKRGRECAGSVFHTVIHTVWKSGFDVHRGVNNVAFVCAKQVENFLQIFKNIF